MQDLVFDIINIILGFGVGAILVGLFAKVKGNKWFKIAVEFKELLDVFVSSIENDKIIDEEEQKLIIKRFNDVKKSFKN